MFKFTFAVVLTAATTALAGVLYLELPRAYDADMVYHPTDEWSDNRLGFEPALDNHLTI
jgi:hypothetical protein